MNGIGSRTGEGAAEGEDEGGVKGAGARRIVCFEINLSYTFPNSLYS